MTTLQEALIADAREHAERLRVVMQDQAAETIESLCDALAQQVEQPTQRQLDTAIRSWESWKAYALELQAKLVKYEGGSPMLLNAAAPAPQAQDVTELVDALESIALAGMSGSGQESEEAMTAWHARQAWKFISIAAKALSKYKGAN